MRFRNRCEKRTGWDVTYTWSGRAAHEWHRCVLERGHEGWHRVKVKNFGRWRRPHILPNDGAPYQSEIGWFTW